MLAEVRELPSLFDSPVDWKPGLVWLLL